MASADLRDDLSCSICLNIYTDPVTLRCGHNFCRECIDRVLDTQEASGLYICPECREEFQERPVLSIARALRNIVEKFLVSQPDQEDTGIYCTYCLDSPVPAIKSCLCCESSLCGRHLRIHVKSPEHVLSDPTNTPGNRKCPIHKKIVEYFCTKERVCICVYCIAEGEHKGHPMEKLDEASEKKKEKLRKDLEMMTSKKAWAEKQVESLEEHRADVQEKATGVTERVTVLFRDVRRELEEVEKRVLSEISMEEEKISQSVSNLIQQLEIQKDELSRKMGIIEELCKTKDPMTILQRSNIGDLCEDGDNANLKRHDAQLRDGGLLDVAWITHMSNTLLDTIKGINVCFYVQEAADVLLDVNTAHNNLLISVDKKAASRLNIGQKRPETPARFQSAFHVMSSQRFTSGQHYWEVDVGGSISWRVGMCYPSMERKGTDHSWIGRNNKSWGLFRNKNEYSVVHNRKVINLPDHASSERVRIFLDYEGGQISFYSVCGTMRHLHTFTATFTEPLYAVLGVWDGFVRVCRGNSR